MGAYLPHIALTAVVLGGAVALLQRGNQRRDLLAMGIASLSAVMWMVGVIAGDVEARGGSIPHFWLTVSQGALLPTVFFAFLSILLLDKEHHPGQRLHPLRWVSPALASGALLAVLIVEPAFFLRDLAITAPAPQKLHLQSHPRLTFSPGPGYYLFLALLGYVIYQAAVYFPRIVDARRLPQDQRSTRLLLAFALTSILWGAGIEVLPTLLGEQAPALLRLVSAVLPMMALVYALTLTRAIEPAQSLRRLGTWALRIAAIGIPLGLVLREGLPELASMPQGTLITVTLLGIVVIDSISLMLRPPETTSHEAAGAADELRRSLQPLQGTARLETQLRAALAGWFAFADLRLVTDVTELTALSAAVESGERRRGAPIVRETDDKREEVTVFLHDGDMLSGAMQIASVPGANPFSERHLKLLQTLRFVIEGALANALAFEALCGVPNRALGSSSCRQWLTLLADSDAGPRLTVRIEAHADVLPRVLTALTHRRQPGVIAPWGRLSDEVLVGLPASPDRTDAELLAQEIGALLRNDPLASMAGVPPEAVRVTVCTVADLVPDTAVQPPVAKAESLS